MKNLIQVRLSNHNNSSDKKRLEIASFYKGVIDHAVKLEVWYEYIKAIIITDNFEDDISKQAKIWNRDIQFLEEKEIVVNIYTLSNQNVEAPELHIFIRYDDQILDETIRFNNLISTIVKVSSRQIIPKELWKKVITTNPSTIEDRIIWISTDLCIAYHSVCKLKELLGPNVNTINHNEILTAFKRRLREILYILKSEEDNFPQCWYNFLPEYFHCIERLINRIINNETGDDDKLIRKDEPSRDLIYSIVDEIKTLTNKCIDNAPYDTTRLVDVILKFSTHLGVLISLKNDGTIDMGLTDDAIDNLNSGIVETEQRIICFLDLLGFKELIKEYDGDRTSSLLQNIQESFANATKEITERGMKDNNGAVKSLQYQTFSDNICISIPFFNNEKSFLHSFALLTDYVRRFQMSMMGKRLFTRGGIAIGSYYADENIIFSGGLVKAYELEGKAIYPRTVIDDKLIAKLRQYNLLNIKRLAIDDSIIFDSENVAFLNPFGSLKIISRYIESSLKEVDDKVNSLTPFERNCFKMVKKATSFVFESEVNKDENQVIAVVKDELHRNFQKFKNSEKILLKYEWLSDFIKWYKKDKTDTFQFRYFGDSLG